MKNYRQRDQPPLALQRAVGDDAKVSIRVLFLALHINEAASQCMALCPSPGQKNLGDQAEPLPPELKEDYKQRKAREKEAKGNDGGLRKKGTKRKRKRKVRFMLVGPWALSTKLNAATALADSD